FPNAQDVKGVRFNRAYFEDVRQYFVHDGTSSNWSVVSFNECHFSKPTTNDVTQTNPLLADYQAKIQFGGDVATGAGKAGYLTVQDCTADILQPANAWVSFVNLNSQVNWFNNASLAPSASFGHIRCTRTSKAAFRAFPAIGGMYPGSYVLGDQSGAGLTHQGGSNIEVSATIAAGATYNISHLAGTHFYLTLPDGDCTIQIDASSAGYYATSQAKAKVILIAPASVGATRTITFGSRLAGAGATLTYTTADNNKRAILMLEGTGKGDVSMRSANGTPSFI
ncbi:MAG: hypothetical protein QE279_10110, partial [Rhodoferax sp.]|nr:hypothetical protein [Rhodoferax sp.]